MGIYKYTGYSLISGWLGLFIRSKEKEGLYTKFHEVEDVLEGVDYWIHFSPEEIETQLELINPTDLSDLIGSPELLKEILYEILPEYLADVPRKCTG